MKKKKSFLDKTIITAIIAAFAGIIAALITPFGSEISKRIFKEYVELNITGPIKISHEIIQNSVISENNFNSKASPLEIQKSNNEWLEQGCYLSMSITNTGLNTVIAKEFKINIKQIFRQDTPAIIFETNLSSEIESREGLEIKVKNIGNGVAKDLDLTIVDKENNFETYLKNKNLSRHISRLNPGEEKVILYASLDELKSNFNDFEFNSEISINYIIKNVDYSDTIFIGRFQFTESKIIAEGMGGALYPDIYGISINTKQVSRREKKSWLVDLELPPNDVIELPIFIFPDESSSLLFNLEFELSNGQSLKTEDYFVKIYVSPYGRPRADDGIEFEKLSYNIEDERKKLTFPFTIIYSCINT